ncbi:MAG: hypothetical protein H6867_09900 [Rhodospirillales bacterium]|nr:hypothetical protein [Rhodospirillales bacterium]MCB9995904.1 hypothetical protein [Rhodospirillales bacterium]
MIIKSKADTKGERPSRYEVLMMRQAERAKSDFKFAVAGLALMTGIAGVNLAVNAIADTKPALQQPVAEQPALKP